MLQRFSYDGPDPSGHGEGQRPLGMVRLLALPSQHFRFAVDGDLTGQFITATVNRLDYAAFAKPGGDGVDNGYVSQTSEFSRAIEVR